MSTSNVAAPTTAAKDTVPFSRIPRRTTQRHVTEAEGHLRGVRHEVDILWHALEDICRPSLREHPIAHNWERGRCAVHDLLQALHWAEEELLAIHRQIDGVER